MSRRVLSITIGLLGLACALAMMVGMGVMGSLLADARSANVMGPGVDVFVRTPLPLADDVIVLDVAARGGTRAGIVRIEVKGVSDHEGAVLAALQGGGASWGQVVRGGKRRGQETRTVRFPVPPWVMPGERLGLILYVDYVIARSSGAGRFENVHEREVLRLELTVHTPASRWWAQVAIVGRGLGLFALWFLVVWGVAALYDRRQGRIDDHGAELEGIGLLMGYGGGGFLGYWLFTRPMLAGLGVTSTVAPVLLTTAWLVLPLAWVWWRWRRRRPPPPDAELPRARVVAR